MANLFQYQGKDYAPIPGKNFSSPVFPGPGGQSYYSPPGKTYSSPVQPQGQVLGTSTGGGPAPTSNLQQLSQTDRNPVQESEYQNLLSKQQNVTDLSGQQRSAIESGYGEYESQLDAMLNEGLPGQQSALETQAKSQFETGQTDLGLQREEGLGLLGAERERVETSQGRNLKDLSNNLRNSFMAGNVFLGAQGAGDSSAANQYAYALTKLGSQQRGDIMRQSGDIMNEIGQRESSLQNIYTREINTIKGEYESKIGQISQWFYDQQNSLRSQKGQLGVQKGQDLASLSQNLLNQAMQEINFIKEQAANKQSMLEQWALNNNQSIQQAKSLINEQAQFNPSLPQAQPIASAPQVQGGNIFANAAYGGAGGSTREEDKLFGGGTSGGFGASGSY